MAVIFFLVGSNPALAHTNSPDDDSVDHSSMEIRYQDHTQWDEALDWGTYQWIRLGTIKILPDVWNTWQDLDVEDIDASDLGQGRWIPSIGSDTIQFNSYWFEQWTLASWFPKHRVGVHEFGHALGIGDNSLLSVMCTPDCAEYELKSHDKFDYFNRWGYPEDLTLPVERPDDCDPPRVNGCPVFQN